MTTRISLTMAGAAGLALIPVIAPAAEQAGVWTLRESLLGAPSNLVITADDEAHASLAASAALAEVERLNGVFNSRRESSELFALNNATSMSVSPELFEVLQQAEAVRLASGGAYNAGLGEALAMWRDAETAPPSADALAAVGRAAEQPVGFDAATRTVTRPQGVSFALDGIAKGYIVDRALAAGMAAAPVKGMLVDIGGEMACQGLAPSGLCWDIGIPDPAMPLDRAPLVAKAHLKDRAIATSGLGPRDRLIGGERYSVTLNPRTGWASRQNIAATVIADTAAQADALATALLVMPAEEGLTLAAASNAQARITTADGLVHASDGWTHVASAPVNLVCAPQAQAAAPAKWNADWAVEIVYSAPDRAVNRRDPDFRSPYMAMWISDGQNRPVRTLVLVGTKAEWQKDNYIWWGMYRDKATRLVELRSTATQLSGAYPTYWPGYNDDWKFMPQGDYILHIETSRERGKHTYRTVKLTLGKNGFTTAVPKTEEGGGLQLTYGRRE